MKNAQLLSIFFGLCLLAPAQTIRTSFYDFGDPVYSGSSGFSFEAKVIPSDIPNLAVTQYGSSVLVKNLGTQPIVSYTIHSKDETGFVNDYAIANIPTGAPVLGVGEEKILTLPGLLVATEVSLDSVMYNDRTTAGKDEAKTLAMVRAGISRPFDGGSLYGGVYSWSCQPSTCYQTITATGSFTVGMSVSGVLTSVVRRTRRNAGSYMTIGAQNCQLLTKIEAYGSTIYDMTYGTGIAAVVDGSQFGVTLVSLGRLMWYYRNILIGNPESPCA